MAVFVDIAKTQHLSYSPLNEKHNILYHRARQNVNQRHIHKPWFDLNPFLDKEDIKGVALEHYKPENDRGILPLESLVIVEEYFDENAQFAKEFQTDEFWDFLFSDNWNYGYSVRVLEGRLQNLLHGVLYKLTKAGQITQHSTVAFAKNRRQRCSIYKHSKKEPEFSSYDETLLLEFIYYGRLTRPIDDQLAEYSSCSYHDVTTCSTTTQPSSDLDSSEKDAETAASLTTDVETATAAMNARPPSTEPTMLHRRRHKLLHRRIKPRDSNLELIHEESSVEEDEKSPSAVPPIPRGNGKFHPAEPQTISNYSTSSDEFTLPVQMDLSKFTCTEKVSYLGEFELSDSGSSDDEEDEDLNKFIDFGQEYYLGDRNPSKHNEAPESVLAHLRKRKEIVSKARAERRQLIKEYNAKPARKTIMPEFSELDVKKYLNDSEIFVTSKDKNSQDLDEYIKTLREQEQDELRYKNKARHRFMELRKKYLNIDPSNEKFADAVGTVTGSQACRVHCYNATDTAWRIMTQKAKRNFLVQKLFQAGGKVHVNPKKKKKPKVILKKKLQIPLIYVSTVSGITYLHPVSKQMLQDKKKAQEEANAKKIQRRIIGNKRVSLLPNAATGLSAEINKRLKHKSTTEGTSIKDNKAVNEKGFPKIKLVSGMESPDEDTDTESDGLEDSPFNTKKLNVRYSVEKIRKANAEKRKKEAANAEDDVFDILKKYYRMQSVLKAFSKGRRKSQDVTGPRKRSMSVFGALQGGLGRRRKTLGPGFQKTQELDMKKKITVGKLKKFAFLDNKKTRTDLPEETFQPMFENYPMDLFREKVERALEEFVVRREIVLSDYSAKASVSITFTKKTVFTKSKFTQP